MLSRVLRTYRKVLQLEVDWRPVYDLLIYHFQDPLPQLKGEWLTRWCCWCWRRWRWRLLLCLHLCCWWSHWCAALALLLPVLPCPAAICFVAMIALPAM